MNCLALLYLLFNILINEDGEVHLLARMKKKACVLVGVKKASASDESILLMVNSETALLVLQLLQEIKRMAKTKGYDHLVEEISWAQEEILDSLLVDRGCVKFC